jgi:hypothetical protein
LSPPAVLIPKNLKTPVSPTPGSTRDHCGDGYRFAKRQGKPNSATPTAIQQNQRFRIFGKVRGANPFRFDSSRTLNCSSNLIGHDHPDKPANGGGE